MKEDVLNYINYLKNNDNFLFENYKNLFLFFESIIMDNDLTDIVDRLENETRKKLNYKQYNEQKLLNNVFDFFNQINKQLSNEFINNVTNQKIIYDNSLNKSHFLTVRNKKTLELEKYIIEIKKTNTIKDCFEMVHEFTHYLINKINKNKKIKKSIINIYDEAIAIYSELLFYDFIRNKIDYIEAKKIIEERLYNCFTQGADLYSSYNAINLITNDKTYEEVSKFFDDDIFLDNLESKVKNNQVFPYEHFIGTIIALKLYFNKTNILDIITLINDDRINELNKVLNISLNTKETTQLFKKIMECI